MIAAIALTIAIAALILAALMGWAIIDHNDYHIKELQQKVARLEEARKDGSTP